MTAAGNSGCASLQGQIDGKFIYSLDSLKITKFYQITGTSLEQDRTS